MNRNADNLTPFEVKKAHPHVGGKNRTVPALKIQPAVPLFFENQIFKNRIDVVSDTLMAEGAELQAGEGIGIV